MNGLFDNEIYIRSISSLNRNRPITKNLIGSWINNGDGGIIAKDPTLNGNGILTNGAFYAQTELGTAVFFDKSDDQIVLPLNIRYQINTFTISAWFKCTTNVTDEQHIFFMSTYSGINSCAYSMRILSSVLQIETQPILASVSGSTTLVINKWYHGAIIHNGTNGTAQVFINGKSDSTVQSLVNTTWLTPIQGPVIGRYDDGVHRAVPFGGYIKNVNMWNRILTQTEIYQLYNKPYIMFE